MPKAHWKIQNQRTKVLNLARVLARSGQHQTHHSILAELEIVEGFADAYRSLTDRAISSQLDRLCAMAQVPASLGLPNWLPSSKKRGKRLAIERGTPPAAWFKTNRSSWNT
ncbi:MAG: hypothetical protein K0Q55_3835 [Verrucomicrobia bacterium]|jgi:hypothetical protein|nr:hypothetical protein [Verrucomicrobiota bacterium]